MSSQSAAGRRRSNNRQYSAEDQALNMISKEAEARLAAKRAARAEAREIRMKEIEKQQKKSEETQDKVYELTSDHAAAKVRQQLSGSRRGSTESTDSGPDIKDVDYKAEVRELEEKYKAAMMTSAQLDNEKQSLVYQVELLKDQLEEQDEGYTELQREFKDKCRECDFQKRDLKSMEHELDILKQQLAIKDRLIEESGFVIVSNESGEPVLEKQSEQSASSNGPLPTGAILVSPETRNLLEKAGGTTLGSCSTLSQPCTKPVQLDSQAEVSVSTSPALTPAQLNVDSVDSASGPKENLSSSFDNEDLKEKCTTTGEVCAEAQSRPSEETLHDSSDVVTNTGVVCEHDVVENSLAGNDGTGNNLGQVTSFTQSSEQSDSQVVMTRAGKKENRDPNELVISESEMSIDVPSVTVTSVEKQNSTGGEESDEEGEFYDAVSTPSPFDKSGNKSFDLENTESGRGLSTNIEGSSVDGEIVIVTSSIRSGNRETVSRQSLVIEGTTETESSTENVLHSSSVDGFKELKQEKCVDQELVIDEQKTTEKTQSTEEEQDDIMTVEITSKENTVTCSTGTDVGSKKEEVDNNNTEGNITGENRMTLGKQENTEELFVSTESLTAGDMLSSDRSTLDDEFVIKGMDQKSEPIKDREELVAGKTDVGSNEQAESSVEVTSGKGTILDQTETIDSHRSQEEGPATELDEKHESSSSIAQQGKVEDATAQDTEKNLSEDLGLTVLGTDCSGTEQKETTLKADEELVEEGGGDEQKGFKQGTAISADVEDSQQVKQTFDASVDDGNGAETAVYERHENDRVAVGEFSTEQKSTDTDTKYFDQEGIKKSSQEVKDFEQEDVKELEQEDTEGTGIEDVKEFEQEDVIGTELDVTEIEKENITKHEEEDVKELEQESVKEHEQEDIGTEFGVTEIEEENITKHEEEDVKELEQESVKEHEQEDVIGTELDVTEIEKENITKHEEEDVKELEQESVKEHEQEDVSKCEQQDVKEFEQENIKRLSSNTEADILPDGVTQESQVNVNEPEKKNCSKAGENELESPSGNTLLRMPSFEGGASEASEGGVLDDYDLDDIDDILAEGQDAPVVEEAQDADPQDASLKADHPAIESIDSEISSGQTREEEGTTAITPEGMIGAEGGTRKGKGKPKGKKSKHSKETGSLSSLEPDDLEGALDKKMSESEKSKTHKKSKKFKLFKKVFK
ncbi:leucine-rich repeat flightless-interacting protein 1 isoform X2 [Aplysia californica]|uniref:Leucine-rich repeat flightless-interacting protein 1 isoform X2 n=1 Tax=Aplysia californica TaxID=6500 RepID=A0ABM1A173_APLCA|nr:leucine-rich repeat flightless-interacting protein 1 isoform X2 [Aplysia californica]